MGAVLSSKGPKACFYLCSLSERVQSSHLLPEANHRLDFCLQKQHDLSVSKKTRQISVSSKSWP